MKGIVESHEGSVEKFIGDAVRAVFGVPKVHEDDALRACRAAVEMRAAFPELGLRGRIGVNTGEVVAGTEERLAAGDAVNVAARLQQASEPDEILIGEATLELVRGAVLSEPAGPLELKGKSEPVAVHRLVSVHDAPERSHESRFVGRDREVELIHDAWRRALAGDRCELVTIVGEAGLGKSRLVAESLTAVDARIVRGRCLPYGQGITYWPVVEVIKQLDALPSDPTAAAAVRSLLGLALSGRFDEARESWEEGVAILEELGLPIAAAGTSQERFAIELLGGDLPAAEAVLRKACETREELGEKGFLSTRAACLALCLVLQDRPAEAEPFLELALEVSSNDAFDVISLVEMARAAGLLSQGALVEAEEHARRAVAAIADWDMPTERGDGLVLLGDVLAAAGRADEAIAAYSKALALYEQKENLVGAGRVSGSLASLRDATD